MTLLENDAPQPAPLGVLPPLPAGGDRRVAARQTTLATSVRCSGVGLHSGAEVRMVLRPAAPDSGIAFRRTDLPGQPLIPARWDHALDGPLCSALGNGEARVATVEHLLSALAGTGVDNALVELDGPELPIMDGSAAPFVFLIECAGLQGQAATRRALRIDRPVRVRDGLREVRLAPAFPSTAAEGLSVAFRIDFESPAIARQSCTLALGAASYKRDVARARTFGFLGEVDRLRAVGLARGGSLDNAVVIDGDRVLNAGGLRYPDEFVRHKILDAIGDLYLAGAPILGRYTGVRAGHALNLRLLRALFATPDAATWVAAPADAAAARASSASEIHAAALA